MDYKQYIAELDELTSTLAKKPQTVGFVHKFFVPGMIGFIQECMVESKMSKAARQPIHKGLNYYECGDKIVEFTEKACDARKHSEDFKGKENDNLDNLAILNSSFSAIEAWTHVYPEIAYWMNRRVGDNYVTCALGIVQKNVEHSISEIVDIPVEKRDARPNSSLSREMKAMGGQLAAMVCNVIVFAAIASLIAAIFG